MLVTESGRLTRDLIQRDAGRDVDDHQEAA